MGYAYPTEFPQPSRARIEAVKIQAGLELDQSIQHLRWLTEVDAEVRKYILRVFDAFALEAVELGRQGLWAVERVDREAREFLSCLTLEAQLQKGHDRQGRAIVPLVDRVFGQTLPEVRREFEKSNEWRLYQKGLLEVAQGQGSGKAAGASPRREPDVAKTAKEPAPTAASDPSPGNAAGHQACGTDPPCAHHWEDVEITFLSDERIQVWIAGRPQTYNYAEFGCMDRRSEGPNQVWRMLRVLAEAQGAIPATNRSVEPGWPAMEKQLERLRKVLKHHFQLSEDPLPFQKYTGYQLRCKIGCAASIDN